MCDELVEEMEHYGQWSGGRHEVTGAGTERREVLGLMEGNVSGEEEQRRVPKGEGAHWEYHCIPLFIPSFKKSLLGRS